MVRKIDRAGVGSGFPSRASRAVDPTPTLDTLIKSQSTARSEPILAVILIHRCDQACGAQASMRRPKVARGGFSHISDEVFVRSLALERVATTVNSGSMYELPRLSQ